MAKSMLGLHWIRVHPDQHDFAHVERMQYRSVKTFEWMHKDRNFCNDLIAAMPKDAYFLARNHPRSEEKEDVWRDPVATGVRHANAWAIDIANGECHLPLDRTFFLGINEPDATTGDRNAIDRYTSAFLDRLRVHGLRGGAFNFSTGHPRTVDGTGGTQADYSVFERSHQAIVEGHHIGVLHIYGTAAVPNVPGHYDRFRACPWQDVTWIVGECGADEHVIGGGNHDGYLRTLGASDAYCRWLDDFIAGVNDPRIHSYQVFTYDFSHPWDSFDIRPIRAHLEAYRWQHAKSATAPVTTRLPTVGTGTPPTQPVHPEIPYGSRIVTVVTANLRLWSSLSATIIREVPPGTVFDMVGYDGDWYQVPRGDGEGDGWLHRSVVKQAPEPQPEPMPQPVSGNDWARCLAFVRRWEGLWADDPNDPGGATMKGITLATYTRWRHAHGQPAPTKNDLLNITDAEVNQIYFEWYWRESGSDKLSWPLCLAQFDTAVNAGPERAREMLERSGGNFLAYMGHLISWYTTIPNFEHFGRAWIRRRAEILLEVA